MYSRADLPRTVAIVVALFLTAVPANVTAREFRAADTQSEGLRDAAIRSSHLMREKSQALEDRSRQQAKAAGIAIVTGFDSNPFEAAMAAIYQTAQRDPAVAAPIERIRKVE